LEIKKGTLFPSPSMGLLRRHQRGPKLLPTLNLREGRGRPVPHLLDKTWLQNENH
jgi:hypothetical protein